jgi:hypothetical protein
MKSIKKKMYLVLATLSLAALASAQGYSANSSQGTPDSSQKQLELRTVVGCLSRTDGTYVITGGAPGPKQFRIVGGDTSRLKGKIGYTVKVVGLVGTSDPVQMMITPFYEGSTTGVTYNTVIAQKLKVVHGNCSEAGKEYAGDKM